MTKRVIVIEDSMTFCERICNMLKRQGWETSKAYNMRKGMELVREADEFTIVLSDLRLPAVTASSCWNGCGRMVMKISLSS